MLELIAHEVGSYGSPIPLGLSRKRGTGDAEWDDPDDLVKEDLDDELDAEDDVDEDDDDLDDVEDDDDLDDDDDDDIEDDDEASLDELEDEELGVDDDTARWDE